eukprot:6214621-Pleurochrysis_carterae.AAC.2
MRRVNHSGAHCAITLKPPTTRRQHHLRSLSWLLPTVVPCGASAGRRRACVKTGRATCASGCYSTESQCSEALRAKSHACGVRMHCGR